MMPGDLTAALRPLVEAFEDLGIRWHIGGSVASSMHGVARSSLDVDLVADLRLEHVRPLLDMLGAAYYADEAAMRDAARRRTVFNLIHLDTMLKVDVFVLRSRPYDRRAFDHRRRDRIGEGDASFPVWVASAEDVILHKLEWYRRGGEVSDRQWSDVIGVLRVQAGALDLEYLERWAGELEVGDLLERALAEAGPGP